MPSERSRLSENAAAVLEMIAAGSSYEQILSAYPHLNYMDIFEAAREALDLSVADDGSIAEPAYRVAGTGAKHARATERWTPAEENHLAQLIHRGHTVAQIATRLQRERSAIRSRILKLNLAEHLSPHEQAELHRIHALDPKDPADEPDASTS